MRDLCPQFGLKALCSTASFRDRPRSKRNRCPLPPFLPKVVLRRQTCPQLCGPSLPLTGILPDLIFSVFHLCADAVCDINMICSRYTYGTREMPTSHCHLVCHLLIECTFQWTLKTLCKWGGGITINPTESGKVIPWIRGRNLASASAPHLHRTLARLPPSSPSSPSTPSLNLHGLQVLKTTDAEGRRR